MLKSIWASRDTNRSTSKRGVFTSVQKCLYRIDRGLIFTHGTEMDTGIMDAL